MPTTSAPTLAQLENASEFVARHIGFDADEEKTMLTAVGCATRAELIDGVVPRSIARLRLPSSSDSTMRSAVAWRSVSLRTTPVRLFSRVAT